MSDTFPYQRVTVTGGAGFLGRFIVDKLKAYDGVEVFVPRSRTYNLIEKTDIDRMLDDSDPDLVIHLAAVVGGIGHNQKNPGKFFYDNLMMGVQLIEQSRLRGIKKFVATGTVCAYPKFTGVPFKEDDLWKGYPEETNAPYGLAKKMMLVQSQSYREQYGFNSIFLLPANLYGPGDNFDLETSHVLAALLRKTHEAKMRKARKLVVWGSGAPRREFLHVDDLASACLFLLEKYDSPEIINVGCGEDISIRELAELICDILGFEGELAWDVTKPDGTPRKLLDITKLRALGWHPTISLRDGITQTYDWFLANCVQ